MSAEKQQLSDRGLARLNRRESCVLVPYKGREFKKGGRWSIGWGHTMRAGEKIAGITWDGVTPHGRITRATADELRRRDVEYFASEVRRLVRVPLTQNQFDACCSLVYNNGPLPLLQTLGERLNAGDYQGAAAAFVLYNKRWSEEANALVFDEDLDDRRKEEAALFVLDDEALTCGMPTASEDG